MLLHLLTTDLSFLLFQSHVTFSGSSTASLTLPCTALHSLAQPPEPGPSYSSVVTHRPAYSPVRSHRPAYSSLMTHTPLLHNCQGTPPTLCFSGLLLFYFRSLPSYTSVPILISPPRPSRPSPIPYFGFTPFTRLYPGSLGPPRVPREPCPCVAHVPGPLGTPRDLSRADPRPSRPPPIIHRPPQVFACLLRRRTYAITCHSSPATQRPGSS